MKVNRSYYLALNITERDSMIKNAKEVGESISTDEYIQIIEEMLFDAFELGIKENK